MSTVTIFLIGVCVITSISCLVVGTLAWKYRRLLAAPGNPLPIAAAPIDKTPTKSKVKPTQKRTKRSVIRTPSNTPREQQVIARYLPAVYSMLALIRATSREERKSMAWKTGEDSVCGRIAAVLGRDPKKPKAVTATCDQLRNYANKCPIGGYAIARSTPWVRDFYEDNFYKLCARLFKAPIAVAESQVASKDEITTPTIATVDEACGEHNRHWMDVLDALPGNIHGLQGPITRVIGPTKTRRGVDCIHVTMLDDTYDKEAEAIIAWGINDKGKEYSFLEDFYSAVGLKPTARSILNKKFTQENLTKHLVGEIIGGNIWRQDGDPNSEHAWERRPYVNINLNRTVSSPTMKSNGAEPTEFGHVEPW